MAPDPDYSELLDQKEIKFIQTVVGIFLYYARSLDPTILRALNDISRIQAIPKIDTLAKSKWFLDYAATYPNSIIQYHESKMVLNIDSDAAYLVMPEARSVYAGYFISVIGILINLISHPPSVTDQFSSNARLFAMLFLQMLKLKPRVHSAMLKTVSIFFPLSSVSVTNNLLPLSKQKTPPLIVL